MRPLTPEVKILTVVKAVVEAIDWNALGWPSMLVRHRRNRNTMEEERPCISIDYIGDAPNEDNVEGSYLTSNEMAVRMALVFEIDDVLPPEVTPEDALDGIEDPDPTGLLGVTTIAGEIKAALKDPDSPLLQWADFAPYEGQSRDPDQNTPDEARLELSMGVIYRVSVTDPRQLLAQGEQA